MHTAYCSCSRPQYECEDVAADGVLFDALGVGLGQAEMYAVMLALKRLGEDPKRSVKTVRFFGKFFGLYADYYVFETTLNEMPEIPEAPGEGHGSGRGLHVQGQGAPRSREEGWVCACVCACAQELWVKGEGCVGGVVGEEGRGVDGVCVCGGES